MAAPVRRPTARVVPVNRHGQVLLLVTRGDDGRPGLMTVGGGVEPGEQPRETAVRELREETGIQIDGQALEGPFHHGTLEWTDAAGVHHLADSQFFTTVVDDVEISFSGHQPEEVGFIVGHEWVRPDDLDGDPRVRNPSLPQIARDAVALTRVDADTQRRITARALPVSPDGAVLLLHEQDPARPGEHYWGSVGGAAEPGESLRDAAVRELHEETGIVAPTDRLVGPLHQHVNTYGWGGVRYLGDHSYFALPMSRDVEVTFDRLEPDEVGNILGAGWWTAEGLVDVVCRPPELPQIVAAVTAAVAGGPQ